MTTEFVILTLLKDFTHLNQSSLVYYFLNSSSKHEQIRIEIEKGKDCSKSVLLNLINDLEDYFHQSFLEIANETCIYLSKYFSNDFCSKNSKISLRVAIKCIVGDRIVTLAQFPNWDIEDIEFKIHEHSAFECFLDGNKEYYLCNSIANAISKSCYKNPRIDIKKAKHYSLNTHPNNKVDTEIDMEWVKCWMNLKNKDTSIDENPPPESCYKSTLVLPISINLQDINSSHFNDFFNINFSNDLNQGKVIVGYLCLDHPLEHFFREDIDIKLAEIIASFLSSYLLIELAYTQYSPIYFQALQIISSV